MRRAARIALSLASLAAVAGSAGLPSVPAATTRARYIVVEVDAAGNLTPIWERGVRLTLPAGSPVTTAIGGDAAGAEPAVEATVVDGSGGVRYREVVRPSEWLRGEFAATSGIAARIEGRLLRRDSSRFVVRVPEIAGSRLLLRRPGAPAVEVAAAVRPPAEATIEAVPAGAIVDAVQTTGSPANRLDLLIVGEGYTESQHVRFLDDVNTMLGSFFDLTPYGEYREFLNITALYVPSREEGADHPTYRANCPPGDPTCCTDPDALSDPRAGTFADTAFDATYCTLGIQRLLTVDDAKVLAAAAAAPDWDVILVLVNDATYGGSGGEVAVVSRDARATQIAQHELGHSFSQLADEYDTAYPGYPGCSDVVGVTPCESNVTDQVARDRVKWSPRILPDTPVPTPPDDPGFAAAVGLFEGARYRTTGMYRPRQHCLMRELGTGFCEVCRQAFVLRLYQGGWGVPAAGVDPIDPGSESPPPGPVLVAAGESLDLGVGLLRPATSPALVVTWLVDGEPIAGATGDHLEWTPPHAGLFRVQLTVSDATGFVDPPSAVPESRREWDVTAVSTRRPRRHLFAATPGR
jgi:hypothetical protein